MDTVQFAENIVHFYSYTRSNLCMRRQNIGSRMTSMLFEFASTSEVIVHFYSRKYALHLRRNIVLYV